MQGFFWDDHLADVPFYNFLQVLFSIELVIELSHILGFEMLWVLIGVVFFH